MVLAALFPHTFVLPKMCFPYVDQGIRPSEEMAVRMAVEQEGGLAREYQAYSDRMTVVVDTLFLQGIHRRVLIGAFAPRVVAGLGFAYTSLL
jgi:hypothetical protein